MNQSILDLLDAPNQPEPSPGAPPLITLWGMGVYYLMFFTLDPDQFATHYDEDARGAYLCLGAACAACAAGLRATEHVYLPVWDAQNRRLAVLKFDTRDNGPAATLVPFLRTYQAQLADIVAVVSCRGRGEFTIVAHAPLPETDRGALACQAFAQGLENGAITLRSCVRRLTAEQIADLPAVRKRATPVVGAAVAPAGRAPAPPALGPAVAGEGG
jgi:hypothetical protein